MHAQLPLMLLLALVWGIAVAVFMQYTALGKFLSLRLTWFMTALGCGVDLLLLLLVIDDTGRVMWWHFVAVFGMSSLGPSFRGILLHKTYFAQLVELMHGTHDAPSQ